MEQKTRETLKSLARHDDQVVRQPVATLSGGQRQSVAVARAVQWNSKLVILDEPTAALGVAQTEQVLALVRRLGEQGLAVVLISHNLHDVFETADRITVLRLGTQRRRVRARERRRSRRSSRRSPPACRRRSRDPGMTSADVDRSGRGRRRVDPRRSSAGGLAGTAGARLAEPPDGQPRRRPDHRRAASSSSSSSGSTATNFFTAVNFAT